MRRPARCLVRHIACRLTTRGSAGYRLEPAALDRDRPRINGLSPHPTPDWRTPWPIAGSVT